MKSSLRIASAALALTLAAGMALPAAAASKPPFSKDKTVYAVLEADGSIRSTTVSEHLYHAGGLSSVTDRTTLTDIVNTESDAEFTQNGESLVWNTSDTDVYYKGNTDKQLPLAAAVTYTLDGVEKPLEELLGQSGHLVVTVQLTNQTAETLTVDGKERTIVTPFVTAVGVLLGQEATNVNAAHGLLESAAKSSAAAFVTLPGVREALDGLLPSGVSALEDYLQDTVTVEADVENLTAPQILIASAASAEALGQGDVFDFGDVSALTDGITQLNDAMQQLLSGAAQLVDGAGRLASGSVQLLDGANQLDSGLGQLVEGLDTLTANNAALTAGAQQVADGVLDSASKSLMENGLIDTPMTWDNYNTVLDEVLQLGERTLAAGRKKMVRTIQAQAPQFKAGWLDLALYLSATQTDSDLEARPAAHPELQPLRPRGLAAEGHRPQRPAGHPRRAGAADRAERRHCQRAGAEGKPEQHPVLCFQRGPVCRRRGCRRCGCPRRQRGQRPADGRRTGPLRGRKPAAGRHRPAEQRPEPVQHRGHLPADGGPGHRPAARAAGRAGRHGAADAGLRRLCGHPRGGRVHRQVPLQNG